MDPERVGGWQWYILGDIGCRLVIVGVFRTGSYGWVWYGEVIVWWLSVFFLLSVSMYNGPFWLGIIIVLLNASTCTRKVLVLKNSNLSTSFSNLKHFQIFKSQKYFDNCCYQAPWQEFPVKNVQDNDFFNFWRVIYSWNNFQNIRQ